MPIEGVSLAFDAGLLTDDPTWTRVDTLDDRFSGYRIRRGRQNELDRTGTGTCTFSVNDVSGFYDPTNSGSPQYLNLDGKQAGVALWNPVTETWHVIFRGFVDDWGYTVEPSQVVTRVTIDCVDGLDFFAGVEMAPDGTFGDTPLPAAVDEGNIYYENAEVNNRIEQLAAEAGWPPELTTIFTGNVWVGNAYQDTEAPIGGNVYSPGSSILAAMFDAADAEFPGVANIYMSKLGILTFHGRHARFDPDGVAAGAGGAWDFHRWKAGDGAAIAADADTAQIRALSFSRSRSRVINHALSTPQGIPDGDIAGQLATDTASILSYGVHSWQAENLITLEHKTNGNNALDETLLFAQYYIDNYAQPRTRVNQLVFKSLHPDDPRAEANWALICGVEISDIIELKTSHPGGGGFDEEFYVEGISYDVTPGPPEYAFVTLTLDLSPAAYWTVDSFDD